MAPGADGINLPTLNEIYVPHVSRGKSKERSLRMSFTVERKIYTGAACVILIIGGRLIV